MRRERERAGVWKKEDAEQRQMWKRGQAELEMQRLLIDQKKIIHNYLKNHLVKGFEKLSTLSGKSCEVCVLTHTRMVTIRWRRNFSFQENSRGLWLYTRFEEILPLIGDFHFKALKLRAICLHTFTSELVTKSRIKGTWQMKQVQNKNQRMVAALMLRRRGEGAGGGPCRQIITGGGAFRGR